MTAFPDLLETLGEVFLVPGATADWAAFAGAPWAPPGLRLGLEALAAAPSCELDVAYAGLFLAGRGIRLELSAVRTGQLRDEGVLLELDGIFEAADVHPEPGVPPDHLGVLLLLLGHLLRRTGEPELPTGRLFTDHFQPLAGSVAQELGRAGVHPFYGAAGAVLAASVDLCSDLLG